MKTLLLALLPTCLALQRQHDSGCPLTGGGGVSDALAFQPVLTGDSGHVQVIRLDDSETYDPKIPENAQGQPDVASDPTDYISFVQPDQSLECPDQPLQVHIINPQEPLIAYISNFVSDEEADYLIRESEPSFSSAYVFLDGVTETNETARKSETSTPVRDHVVKCIEQRAAALQSWKPGLALEMLSVQRYKENGFFTHHFDSFGPRGGRTRGDRLSTFNVFLGGDCTGGGTNFPYLTKPEDPNWCQFIECDGENPGVTFKPIKGNAVFWQNVAEDGQIHPVTWHAGLPVLSGTKVGLNIWTWYQPQGQA